MKNILDRYLDRVLVYANKPQAESETIRRELKDHLLEKIDDLIATGVPKEEATLEALRQHGSPKTIGYKLRGPFPWVDIRSQGTARGVIAIGPRAIGIFAFGGVAVGVVACGGMAAGVFSAGGLAFGLLFAWAGLGIGGIVAAGLALGLIAVGGLAIGVVAQGAQGIGLWSPPWGHYSETMSYFTAQNVPTWLRALEPLLNADVTFSRYFAIITPFYILAVMGLSLLQVREGKRIASADDWLIDG